MEKALQLVFSHQVKDGVNEPLSTKALPSLRPTCVETPAAQSSSGGSSHYTAGASNRTLDSAIVPKTNFNYGLHGLNSLSDVASTDGCGGNFPSIYNSNKPTDLPLNFDGSPLPTSAAFSGASCSNSSSTPSHLLPVPQLLGNAVPAQNSPSVLMTGVNRRPKLLPSAAGADAPLGSKNATAGTATTTAATGVAAAPTLCHIDPVVSYGKPNTLLKAIGDATAALPAGVITYEGTVRCGSSGNLLASSDSSQSLASGVDDDQEKHTALLSDSGESKEEKPVFFKAKPRRGEFTAIIDWLLRCGESGEITMPFTKSQAAANKDTDGPVTVFNEDYIMKLCAAATMVLAQEPTLLELEVHAADSLIVVGDIHGQFQDLYTSVLCQQYDHRRRNPNGADRRFLFMGDYVDRGPHSLEVVLLLLALKVEYPTLVYLTRGNHEEEKTSRVYGFLTEATSALGKEVGSAVWSAVNKVFLDLPLAALVTAPRFRFLVMHGGLSPALQTVEQIAGIDRHAYNTGELPKEAHDIVDGLLWSDPVVGVGCFASSARGCGWSFGPAVSNNFCVKNRLNFICRAHQLAMDGYFWTHNDRVVTLFSAPNYCGINDNRGAVMVVSGSANKPSFEQYEYYEDEMEYGGEPSANFPYSSYFR